MKGIQDEFAKLVSCHSRQIFGFILTLSQNRADAEDIFQNTSVVLWRKFRTYQEGTNFKAWACKIAYYEILEHRRQKSRLHRLLSEEAFEVLAKDTLAYVETTSMQEGALADCLEKLARRDRALIERRYFNAQSAKEIAERTSKSVQAIYRSLSRIHDSLLQCVRQSLVEEGQ